LLAEYPDPWLQLEKSELDLITPFVETVTNFEFPKANSSTLAPIAEVEVQLIPSVLVMAVLALLTA
jgi:hypothetical protein